MAAYCPFCDLLRAPQEEPTFIAEFDHSVAFLDFDQDNYKGGALLILKEHHEHLHLTPLELQQAIVPELANLTCAILKAYGGFRANHMSLGNGTPHVHWFVVPRYPNDLNTGHAPKYNDGFKKLSDDEYRQMAMRLQAELPS